MPLRLARACWQSLSALRRIRPAVVLGMGGYVAFPGGLMAALVGYPLVVHEQNSVAGLTNRLLARWADRVLEAFPARWPVRYARATRCAPTWFAPIRLARGIWREAARCGFWWWAAAWVRRRSTRLSRRRSRRSIPTSGRR